MGRFGIQITNFKYPGVPDEEIFDRIVEMCRAAEEAGFESVWVQDHFYTTYSQGPRWNPTLENYVLLGALAAATTKLRLGTLATCVTYRNPALLAKMVTSLDVISKGRAILGIGAGWNEVEHRGMGFDFPSTKERLDRLDEAVQICRRMFTEPFADFDGVHYRVDEVMNFPRPVQPGGPPILVGGRGEKRTLRTVAMYADMSNLYGGMAATKRSLDVLRAHCEEVGRDPSDIIHTRMGSIIMAPTHEEAMRKSEEYREMVGLPREFWDGFLLAGDPDTVCEALEPFFDLGIDEMQFGFYDGHEIEPILMAGEVLNKAFP